jgi:hypothetical protein
MRNKFLNLILLVTLISLISGCKKESNSNLEDLNITNSTIETSNESNLRASDCEVTCIGGSCSVTCAGEGASCHCSWGFANCDCSTEEAQVTNYNLSTEQADILEALATHVGTSLKPVAIGIDLENAINGFTSAVSRQNQADFTFFFNKVTSILSSLSTSNQDDINSFLHHNGYPPIF